MNSLNAKGPEYITEFYLDAYLKTLKNEGYSIFVVLGQYPPSLLNTGGRGEIYKFRNIVNTSIAARHVTSNPSNPSNPGGFGNSNATISRDRPGNLSLSSSAQGGEEEMVRM